MTFMWITSSFPFLKNVTFCPVYKAVALDIYVSRSARRVPHEWRTNRQRLNCSGTSRVRRKSGLCSQAPNFQSVSCPARPIAYGFFLGLGPKRNVLQVMKAAKNAAFMTSHRKPSRAKAFAPPSMAALAGRSLTRYDGLFLRPASVLID